MKHFSTLLFLLLFVVTGFCQGTIYEFSVKTIHGDTIDLSQFAGKKLLVVNTASQCGYTPQYAKLEQLYLQYGGEYFEIVGFPCNDFGLQEPGSDSAINEFCTDLYSVTFPMMSKIHTVSGDTAPIYKWLQRQDLNGVSNATVEWNFNKFLIDERGHWIKHFNQLTLPTDTAIVNWILKPSIYTSTSSQANIGQVINSSPVNEVLNLQLNNIEGGVTVKILTLNGQEIAEVFNGMHNNDAPINYNTRSLSAGMYLLSIQSTSGLQTIKMVVVH